MTTNSIVSLNLQTAPAVTAPKSERNSLTGRISAFVKNIFESIKSGFGYMGAKVSAFFAPLTNRVTYLFSKSPVDKKSGVQNTPVTTNTVEENTIPSNIIPLNAPKPVIEPTLNLQVKDDSTSFVWDRLVEETNHLVQLAAEKSQPARDYLTAGYTAVSNKSGQMAQSAGDYLAAGYTAVSNKSGQMAQSAGENLTAIRNKSGQTVKQASDNLTTFYRNYEKGVKTGAALTGVTGVAAVVILAARGIIPGILADL